MADTAAPVLAVRNASKRFGAVTALAGVDLHVDAGEVLALMGDNGAGKSTLIKAVSGVHRLDSGEILIDGQAVKFHRPADARGAGIETVYQDLALFGNLGPTENFYAGREIAVPPWLPPGLRFMSSRQMRQQTREVLDRLKIVIQDHSALVALMSGGQRQAIAVARAAAFAKRVVMLDEPTAALGLRETRQVLDLIHRLKDEGIAIILISHSMDDVIEVADRVMVLRRGCKVGELPPTAETHEEIVSLIVRGGETEPATT